MPLGIEPGAFRIAYQRVCVIFSFVSDVKKFSMLGALTPAGESSAFPLRFCGVPGFEGRQNDVIYCHPVVQTDKQSTVVFFGGDMQVKQKQRATWQFNNHKILAGLY